MEELSLQKKRSPANSENNIAAKQEMPPSSPSSKRTKKSHHPRSPNSPLPRSQHQLRILTRCNGTWTSAADCRAEPQRDTQGRRGCEYWFSWVMIILGSRSYLYSIAHISCGSGWWNLLRWRCRYCVWAVSLLFGFRGGLI